MTLTHWKVFYLSLHLERQYKTIMIIIVTTILMVK